MGGIPFLYQNTAVMRDKEVDAEDMCAVSIPYNDKPGIQGISDMSATRQMFNFVGTSTCKNITAYRIYGKRF
jgi:hypothetical protein